MQIGEYTLVNEEKVQRALKGVSNQEGLFIGGIEKEDGSFDEGELLARYDQFLGLIRKGDDKLAHGCFYDFKAKKPRAVPEITFIYRVNGQVVEVPEGKKLPGIVKAAKILEEQVAVKKIKRGKSK